MNKSTLIIFLLLAFVFAGCGGGASSGNDADIVQEEPAPAPEPEPLKDIDVKLFSSYSFYVYDMGKNEDYEEYKAQAATITLPGGSTLADLVLSEEFHYDELIAFGSELENVDEIVFPFSGDVKSMENLWRPEKPADSVLRFYTKDLFGWFEINEMIPSGKLGEIELNDGDLVAIFFSDPMSYMQAFDVSELPDLSKTIHFYEKDVNGNVTRDEDIVTVAHNLKGFLIENCEGVEFYKNIAMEIIESHMGVKSLNEEILGYWWMVYVEDEAIKNGSFDGKTIKDGYSIKVVWEESSWD